MVSDLLVRVSFYINIFIYELSVSVSDILRNRNRIDLLDGVAEAVVEESVFVCPDEMPLRPMIRYCWISY